MGEGCTIVPFSPAENQSQFSHFRFWESKIYNLNFDFLFIFMSMMHKQMNYIDDYIHRF